MIRVLFQECVVTDVWLIIGCFRNIVIAFLLSVFPFCSIAHTMGPLGLHVTDLHDNQIQQVKTMLPFNEKDFLAKAGDEGCITSPYIVFDVKDSYAFNIDETVDISFDIDLNHQQSEVLFQYDKNGSSAKEKSIILPKASNKRWHHQTIRMDRARFAGRTLGGGYLGIGVGDFRIRLPIPRLLSGGRLTVCNVTLTRSYKNSVPVGMPQGYLNLHVSDETGVPTAARVGIYDATNRMPLLGSRAIKLPYFEVTRQDFVLDESRIAWPHTNRRAFYFNGNLQKQLPIGTYQVVVARGLEYQFYTKTVEIVANKETVVPIQLSRFSNMPSKGWYSGDPHIHAARHRATDNEALFSIAQAEDVHVANIMQMGNVGESYFHQYAWGKAGKYERDSYALVSGQEDPRTTRMGHTLHLNLKAPVRNTERYYLYNEVFDAVHEQGGLSGYAHGGGQGFAVELPFRGIDFIEILQVGDSNPEHWFDALNLGYRLTPIAGSDYPYLDNVVGSVRTYVQTGKFNTSEAWFDGVKAGKVFVTNGPLLSLAVNGKGIGSELNVVHGQSLTIEARAHLNPDIDQLDRLELIEHGKVITQVKSIKGEQSLSITHNIKAIKGGWFVIRALGKQKQKHGNIVAYSAPIYVTVDGQGWCDTAAVPNIVKGIRSRLANVLNEPVEDERNNEPWDGKKAMFRVWEKNKVEVSERVNKALKEYDRIVEFADRGQCI